MAKASIRPLRHAPPEERVAARSAAKVSGTIWWPLATMVVLVVLFDPLGHLTPQAVFLVAAVVAVALGSCLVVAHNKPMRLRPFDGLFLLLIFYMTNSLIARTVAGAADVDALLRFLRLATQICVFYVIVKACIGRPALRARCLQLFWWIVILSCLFALLQSFGQQTGAFDLYFEYQRKRTSSDLWQVNGQFAEPAMLGQFLVAALFLFFARIDSVRRSWAVFTLIIVTAGLTQSVGTLAGVIAWALFLIVYNYRDLLSLRRLAPKLLVVFLIVVAFASFAVFSRLSLLELGSLQLDNSGEQRVTFQYALIGYLVESGWTDVLFGVGENEAETLRLRLGFSDVGGSALVELMIRYGLFALVLLLALFTSVLGLVQGLMLFAIFALLGQIDGAVAKPFIWFYSALIALGLLGAKRGAGDRHALWQVIGAIQHQLPETGPDERQQECPHDSIQSN